MREHISKLFAVLLLVGSIYGFILLKESKVKNKPVSVVVIPTAYVSEVKNESVPVSIMESGRISAKDKIDLFTEVQGVMETSSKEFKPGSSYKKGELLLKIRSDDFYANLQAQKSLFQNLITGIMPDIKLDYPEAYEKWNAYLKLFDMDKSIAELPKPGSDKEKFFLTGKNIYTTYYTTKNLEIVYKKYTITAPFDGILTEALVTPGALVRNGQKLGEFINIGEYEMEMSISRALLNSVSVGTEVTVSNPENPDQTWIGKVSRINGKVNSSTQTVQIYVDIKGDDLKEGMYLQAELDGKAKLNAIEISRNLLIDGNQIYVVSSDSSLNLTSINVVHKSRYKAVIQGVEDGVWVVDRPISGAYVGMKVLVKEEN